MCLCMCVSDCVGTAILAGTAFLSGGDTFPRGDMLQVLNKLEVF